VCIVATEKKSDLASNAHNFLWEFADNPGAFTIEEALTSQFTIDHKAFADEHWPMIGRLGSTLAVGCAGNQKMRKLVAKLAVAVALGVGPGAPQVKDDMFRELLQQAKDSRP